MWVLLVSLLWCVWVQVLLVVVVLLDLKVLEKELPLQLRELEKIQLELLWNTDYRTVKLE